MFGAFIGIYGTVSVNFHEIVFTSDILSKKCMYMKTNKVGKNMWLRAQKANQNLEHNAQTQDGDGMHIFFFVIYDTVRDYISTLLLLIGAPSPQPQRFRWGSRHGTSSTTKLKLFNISRRSCPVKFFFFFNNFTLYLWMIWGLHSYVNKLKVVFEDDVYFVAVLII